LLFSYSISAIQPQLGLYCNTHVVADSQCHCVSVSRPMVEDEEKY